MISASLLTALKITIPVGAVATMGSAVYFASDFLPKRTNSDAVYLLVKGKTTSTFSSKALSANANSKTTKNYLCQSTIDKKTIEDKDCSLFKLNSQTTSSDTVDIHNKMFEDAMLASDAGAVTTSSHHILKVSKAFYSSLQKATSTKEIQLTSKEDKTKHLGIVTEVSKLSLKNKLDLANQTTNLFLARISVKGSATITTTDSFTCKLSDTKTVDCKLFDIATAAKSKTNDLSKTDLSNLKAPTEPLTIGNYLVVELTNAEIKVSELQNKTITINKKPAAGATATAEANKVADIIFDQVLIGQVNNTTPSSSTIFPITPKFKSFVVKKGTPPSDGFTNITTSTTKNYKCKFTSESKESFDNSCELKQFPTLSSKTIHNYSSIQTTTLTGVQSDLTNKDHFILTVDTNKLHTLKVDWTKATPASVVVLEDVESNAKTQSFTLLQELTPTKAEGRTDLTLVKYKTQSTVPTSTTLLPASGKCFFVDTDKTGFDCTFKKVNTSPQPASPYDNIAFETTATTTFTATDHFALITTNTTRPIRDFAGNTIYFHNTASSTNTKYTFDIIASMGGDVTANKTLYFLEAPRTTVA